LRHRESAFEKGPDAFRTISEAADEVGAAAHVLRFWESRLSCIRPLRRPGGRRFYRPADLKVLSAVRRLLHDEGYTIKALEGLSARAVLARADPAAPEAPGPSIKRQSELAAVLARAIAAKQRLDDLLSQSSV
jgi:DNA-binding transcriptional MerR regulator